MIQEQFLIIGNIEFNYLYNHWQYSYSYEANHVAAHDILCVSTLKDIRVFDEIIYADFECNDLVTSVSINYWLCPPKVLLNGATYPGITEKCKFML